MTWLVQSIGHLLQPGTSIQLAMDGAYASSEPIRPLMRKGVTVISRPRKDAKLLSLPGQRRPGQRGRSRVYGTQQFSLAKRAGQSKGWQSITYRARKQTVTRHCKTFLATSTLVRGVIRVVIVRCEDGSVAGVELQASPQSKASQKRTGLWAGCRSCQLALTAPLRQPDHSHPAISTSEPCYL